MECTIGIDEVGRGALAGPVSVGGFLIYKKTENIFNQKVKEFVVPLRDSKKLSKVQRDKWNSFLYELRKEKLCDFCVAHVSAETIDEKGISFALSKGVSMVLKKLTENKGSIAVLLDGGLKAPSIYKNQKTIIKGDETEYAISFASIIAKVSRDTLVSKYDSTYPQYGFSSHVGYGTPFHIEAIKKEGSSDVHRKSFLRNI